MAIAPLVDRVVGVTETLQNAAVATGNGANCDLAGYNALTLQVTIATTATVTFEASIDNGATWFGVALKKVTDGTFALTATASGVFYMPSDFPPATQFRARISSWTAGAVTVASRKQALS